MKLEAISGADLDAVIGGGKLGMARKAWNWAFGAPAQLQTVIHGVCSGRPFHC